MKRIIFFLSIILLFACSNDKKYINAVSDIVKCQPTNTKHFDKSNETFYEWDNIKEGYSFESIKNSFDKIFGQLPTESSKLKTDFDSVGNISDTGTEYFVWENSSKKINLEHTINIKGNKSSVRLFIVKK